LPGTPHYRFRARETTTREFTRRHAVSARESRNCVTNDTPLDRVCVESIARAELRPLEASELPQIARDHPLQPDLRNCR
jgi:hypothetical protein